VRSLPNCSICAGPVAAAEFVTSAGVLLDMVPPGYPLLRETNAYFDNKKL
jgi:hypothetical protein